VTCIAVIPARGGSKGIPHKNLALVDGTSLVERAIAAAQQCKSISRIIVTSDDQTILDKARDMKVEFVTRPAELAADDSPIEDAVLHALDSAQATSPLPQSLVLLQPTSPLRDYATLEAAVREFVLQGKYGAMFGVVAAEHHPAKMLRRNGDTVEPFTNVADLSASRQQLPEVFRQSGSIYIANVARFRAERTLFLEPVGFIEVDAAEAIDIDVPADLINAIETSRRLSR